MSIHLSGKNFIISDIIVEFYPDLLVYKSRDMPIALCKIVSISWGRRENLHPFIPSSDGHKLLVIESPRMVERSFWIPMSYFSRTVSMCKHKLFTLKICWKVVVVDIVVVDSLCQHCWRQRFGFSGQKLHSCIKHYVWSTKRCIVQYSTNACSAMSFEEQWYFKTLLFYQRSEIILTGLIRMEAVNICLK